MEQQSVLASAFDNLSKDYDRKFDNFITSWMRYSTRKYVPKLRLKQDSSIPLLLEIGVGTGKDTVWFLKQGYHVIATDISKKMCLLTERRVMDEFHDNATILNRFQTLNVGSTEIHSSNALVEFAGKIDVCYSSMGILNTEISLIHFLKSLKVLLKPKALLIFSIMNREGWWINFWHFLRFNKGIFSKTHHDIPVGSYKVQTKLYTLSEIQTLIEPLYTIKTLQTFPCLLPPPFLTSLKRSRFLSFIAKLEPFFEKTLLHRFGDHILIIAQNP